MATLLESFLSKTKESSIKVLATGKCNITSVSDRKVGDYGAFYNLTIDGKLKTIKERHITGMPVVGSCDFEICEGKENRQYLTLTFDGRLSDIRKLVLSTNAPLTV